MDIAFKILLWLHLMGLIAGSGGGIANSAIGPAIGKAGPETRPTLWMLSHAMSRTSMTGFGLLLFTGPIMLLLRYSSLSEIPHLFWVKMILVAVLMVTVTITVRSGKKAEAGDMAAAARLRRIGPVNGILSLFTVGVAVFTFS
jgi:putative membrane protein